MKGDGIPRTDTGCSPPAKEPAQPAASELRSFCQAVLELPHRDSHSRDRFLKLVVEWATSLHNRLPVGAS